MVMVDFASLHTPLRCCMETMSIDQEDSFTHTLGV
jgi:hypothetical protein